MTILVVGLIRVIMNMDSMSTNQIIYILFFIPFFMSFSFAIFKQIQSIRAIGTVVHVEKNVSDSKVEFKEVFEYTTEKGEKFEVTPIFSPPFQPKIGDVVDIYYTLKKPSKGTVGRIREIYFIPLILFLIAPILATIFLDLL